MFDSKTLLAKLLATENLTVQQRKVHTASFDVENRILSVPILDRDISSQVYDLFMGHEVGHARYTPLEGLKQLKELKISKSIVNVVEDARIERKIKHKYPGLKSSFVRAYKELYEDNFFGTKEKDIHKFNFIDRANLFYKVGPTLGFIFEGEERELIDAMDSTQTFEDVVDVSRRIMEYMKKKEEEEEKEEQKTKIKTSGENQEGEEQEFEEEMSETNRSDDGEESNENTEPENEEPESKDASANGNGAGEDIRSETDDNYERNKSRLYSKENFRYVYVDLPEANVDEIIIPHKKLYGKLRDWFGNQSFDQRFQEIRRETNKVVSYMAREFEMRKNADQMKRASTAKTGELDMKRIFSYGFSEDLFKKMTIMPNGKSHGLVMFLDWSGSMSTHIENTVKQLFSLVMFCRKVNIPFDVYAFTDNTELNEGCNEFSRKHNEVLLHRFCLPQIFSSTMNTKELNEAFCYMDCIARHPRYAPTWLRMGGTPLNESIVAAMNIVPQFKEKYKLQIVNTVFLTDGEGSYPSYYVDGENIRRIGFESTEDFNYYSNYRVVITDKKNKHQEIVDYRNSQQYTRAFVKLLKHRTGCNIVGFYVLNTRELGGVVRDIDHDLKESDIDKLKNKFRTERSIVLTNAGYDEYYLLRSNGMNIDDEDEFTVKENATQRGLVTAFSKYNADRMLNKVVLNRFIGMIS